MPYAPLERHDLFGGVDALDGSLAEYIQLLETLNAAQDLVRERIRSQGQDNDGDNVYDESDSDCAPIPGDCDGDGNVDLADLSTCLFGPDGGLGAGCECVDFDGDNDTDLEDFAAFQAELNP